MRCVKPNMGVMIQGNGVRGNDLQIVWAHQDCKFHVVIVSRIILIVERCDYFEFRRLYHIVCVCVRLWRLCVKQCQGCERG